MYPPEVWAGQLSALSRHSALADPANKSKQSENNGNEMLDLAGFIASPAGLRLHGKKATPIPPAGADKQKYVRFPGKNLSKI
jgi:hypothetical protein